MNRYHVNIDSGFQPQTYSLSVPVQDVSLQNPPKSPIVTYANYVENNVIKNQGNPFDFTYRFMNTHRALKRITLKNVQMPYGFYNIRTGVNILNLNSTNYTLTPGYYTQAQLITALNTAVSGVGTFAVVSQTNTLSNQLQFTPVSGATFGSSLLNTLLGFTSGQTSSGTTVLIATNQFTVNFDTYVYIYINNLGISSQEPIKYTFKVPLNNTTFGSTLFWSDENQNHQSIEVTDNAVRVDRLQIQVLDRFGNILNNNGLDWSMTLEITSDT
jgi:hypothetical protein